MISLALITAAAILLTLAFTPLCRSVSTRLGWVDQPGPRKVHAAPVPRTGGIAILAAYAMAFVVLFYSPLGGARNVAAALPGVWALLPAVIVAFLTGLLDDILGLDPWMKLFGQLLAAVLACQAQVEIRSIAGHSLAATWLPVPLTILWLVACSNAFNLIDGLDGLAAGVGIFATATACLSATLAGNYALALATAPLLGALVGFLPYNFNPASIFMGDCGSLTVGFLLGCFGIIWSQKSVTLLGMTAPLIALAIPLLDTALAVARRFLRRQPLFASDRGHIHHRLLARGFTPRRVAYVIYAFSGILAGLSLLLGSAGRLGGIALVAFCAVVWLAIQYLGYEEFDAARHMIFGGFFRRALNANLSINHLETAVRAASTLDECWGALIVTSRSCGFCEASLDFNGVQLTARLIEIDAADCWDLRIPLNHSGHVHLRVPLNSSQPPATIGRLVNSVGTVFAGKLAEFSPAAPPLALRKAASAG
ncbi:MAG TPA: MraY family glycosyltransferase [Candidatus Acidoferrales bacterium]|nr:MraY family glycosyltransferase [Candidatus Acidoferrales bacterium]